MKLLWALLYRKFHRSKFTADFHQAINYRLEVFGPQGGGGKYWFAKFEVFRGDLALLRTNMFLFITNL